MEKITLIAARLLLTQVFLVSIVIQLSIILKDPSGYEHYQVYLGQFGLPGLFAPLMILIQLLGGVGLLLGYKTRVSAHMLAGYAVFVAFVMKLNEPIIFMQYLAIAGGMLLLAARGPGPCSLDNLKR